MQFKEFAVKDLDVKSVYHLLISGISPRPIALVGSIDLENNSNLAPFSFFNAFGANPPIVGFSPALSGRTGLPKDTLLNIRQTKEFTVSIVNSSMVEQISLASCEFDKSVDEFEKTGLTKFKSNIVSPYAVSESNFIMECKLYDILELGNKPASGNLILGEVLKFHINESILDSTDKIDPYKLDPIARNGGSWYTEAKKGLFELKKPNNIGIGFDAIPDKIKKSKHFNGSQLAKLAGIEKIPENLKLKQNGSLSELYSMCQEKLESNQIQDAWQIIFNIIDYE